MSKKLKELMRVIKEHKKTSIGVAVALAIAITSGVSYSILSNTYNKTNNTALSEKINDTKEANKDNIKTDEAEATNDEAEATNESEANKSTPEDGIEVEQTKDGNVIVKDQKTGNIIADSSKGDDVKKVINSKKDAGSSITIKNDKTGKVEKVEDIKDVTATGEGTITIVKPENKPENTENNKPDSSSENKPESKPENNEKEEQPAEQPEETPQPSKPVEKPVEQPKNVQYMADMSQQLWSDFNAYRQSKGLNALSWSGKYATWTKNHVEEMAKKNTGSYHVDYPEGGQVTGSNSNKNLTASEILQQFKNSPAHNKNILDDELTEGACAVYKSADGGYYFAIGFDY
ncbi:CAP domain-containing protein [Clostridium perfringens]|uniref:CAP domain-containing protein n=1 Tax=Clostridium perfringens TaxID=1502 RepID=UPI00115A1085|nr:CAP domain-containing protein [Clostridium perfringens]ELP5177958.1 CAP domain-containing protein [Clostridium perfringens]ELP5181476.1 CAP domain-containing protein [Clostridium perfringens]ELP5183498.1 CAP domain-containing protein [Clostridium perfringens]ELP5187729.1 CAP domain-containing protein [Clostridium perfringens]MDM0666447.1 CAP domain-containing protein [Clostridium perfringens]